MAAYLIWNGDLGERKEASDRVSKTKGTGR
jgi:hypothetical protein